MSLPPWNPKNVLLELSDIDTVLSKYGITKKSKKVDMYRRAMTHKSYAKKKKATRSLLVGMDDTEDTEEVVEYPAHVVAQYKDSVPLQEISYERLEFLGDAVLGMVIAQYLWERYPDQDEGFLTRTRSDIVRKESLAQFSKKVMFNQFILLSQHVEQITGRNNTNILEDVFEAFLGAVYLDLGITTCRKFIINLIEKEVDMTEIILNDKNYKDILLRFYQKCCWEHPKYTLEKTEGPSHHRVFTMVVLDNKGKKVGRGTAHSKKKAEQEASRRALLHFGVIKRKLM
jgi:ribonuclease III